MLAKDIVSKYQAMIKFRKIADELESDLEMIMHTYMGQIWKKHALGENWEHDEPYHLGCDMCRDRAIALLQRLIIDEPDLIL